MAFDKSELKFKNTVLLVKDVSVSKKFYTEIMEQKIEMDIGINVGFQSGLALWEMEFGEYTINNCVEKDEHKFTPQAPRQNSTIELYFEIAKLEDIHNKIVERGMEIAHNIIAQPWGQNIFRFYDPDGYLIEVGEPMWAVVLRLHDEGLSLNEIHEKSKMPLEIVKLIIKMNFGM